MALSSNDLSNIVTDHLQFDLKFTKGNTVIAPTKLDYLQRRYAEKYVEERGPVYNDMVEQVAANLRGTSTATNR